MQKALRLKLTTFYISLHVFLSETDTKNHLNMIFIHADTTGAD